VFGSLGAEDNNLNFLILILDKALFSNQKVVVKSITNQE
jgi:hypothetical protein